MIRLTKENIDALNAQFAGFQHPPLMYIAVSIHLAFLWLLIEGFLITQFQEFLWLTFIGVYFKIILVLLLVSLFWLRSLKMQSKNCFSDGVYQ